MRQPKFAVGDVVRLVSGGPEMAVREAMKNLDKEFIGRYRAQWFAGKKLESGEFAEATLTLVTKVTP
ncbi:YodC family protein [Aeromonas caviae]|uniref:YodC family protein n=1 Tax=Aeromonas caviae TaxID=648 RepID=UPI0038CF878D